MQALFLPNLLLRSGISTARGATAEPVSVMAAIQVNLVLVAVQVFPADWVAGLLFNAIPNLYEPNRLVDKKNVRRYDNCLSYTLVASKKALLNAKLDREVCLCCNLGF